MSAELRRVLIGRDVTILRETFNGLMLEGHARLAPGRPIEIVLPRLCRGKSRARRAHVAHWELFSLGSDGPVYRGFCRWE